MKSYLYHLQVNINTTNISFYKDLMLFLGWRVIFEDKDVIGYKSNVSGDLWFVKSLRQEKGDYDKFGVNHIAVRVNNLKDVDKVVLYLKKQKVDVLFDTPRHRKEFSSSSEETYYQVMFESPDKILFEVVYIGPKN